MALGTAVIRHSEPHNGATLGALGHRLGAGEATVWRVTIPQRYGGLGFTTEEALARLSPSLGPSAQSSLY